MRHKLQCAPQSRSAKQPALRTNQDPPSRRKRCAPLAAGSAMQTQAATHCVPQPRSGPSIQYSRTQHTAREHPETASTGPPPSSSLRRLERIKPPHRQIPAGHAFMTWRLRTCSCGPATRLHTLRDWKHDTLIMWRAATFQRTVVFFEMFARLPQKKRFWLLIHP